MHKKVDFVLPFFTALMIAQTLGCGSDIATAAGGGGTAIYTYVAQKSSPYTILRFPAGARGATTPSLTITLPAGVYPGNFQTDSSGNLYVAGLSSEILVYAQNATTPSRTLTLADIGPIAVDSTGQIYLAGLYTNTVYVYAAGNDDTATLVRQFTISGIPSTASITDCALDSSNHLYVAYGDFGSNRGGVVEYSGTSTSTVAPDRTITPATGSVNGVAVDESGDVYISDNVQASGTTTSGTLEVFGAASDTPIRTVKVSSAAVNELGALKVDSAGYIYAVVATGELNAESGSIVEVGPGQTGMIVPVASTNSKAYTKPTSALAIN